MLIDELNAIISILFQYSNSAFTSSFHWKLHGRDVATFSMVNFPGGIVSAFAEETIWFILEKPEILPDYPRDLVP